jgi:hypothetical protein
MPTIKLTKGQLKRIKAPDPSGKQKIVWDAELKGFGVLISGVTATKTFIATAISDWPNTAYDGRRRQ